MREWPSMKARRVLGALFRRGWIVSRDASSHHVLAGDGWADPVFACHDGHEVGPRMLARIAKRAGLRPEDLYRVSRRTSRRFAGSPIVGTRRAGIRHSCESKSHAA